MFTGKFIKLTIVSVSRAWSYAKTKTCIYFLFTRAVAMTMFNYLFCIITEVKAICHKRLYGYFPVLVKLIWLILAPVLVLLDYVICVYMSWVLPESLSVFFLQLGVRRPAQGSHPSRGQICRSRDSNPRPRATSPTLHTVGHGRPWKDEALHGFACKGHANLLCIDHILVYVPPWRDQLEREIRRYGVSTGPVFNFGVRKELSGLLKWLLGV